MARESKSEQVYVQLKQDILNGTLSPGQSLSAIDVGTRFSASRTPVRQAFLRLEADGLVSLTDRQGARVAPISIKSVRDLFELRILLEAAAARMVAEAVGRDTAARQQFDEVADALGAISEEDPSESRRDRFYELTETYDQAVIAHTRNSQLARSIAELRPHTERLRNIAHSHPDRLDVSLAEHRAMCRAILAGDGPAAAAACTEHLTQTQKTILDAVVDPQGSAVAIDLVTA
ncbi:GntR family transcriptional regulator [Rhodococcus opacus]|uniref:GntR family transcriptional regulator n=1 Tax=Rhodococcus opacus TaxID=37919 RepID=A0AAX3YHZ3_RHOOP|nr:MULTISPECIES: GntR family transcriptional regulator [Rhodococcus]ELB91537.1 GntR family transcriptional regulator [Rhodococcus wratislaviensis IFP 2016]NHU45509.1 GntR family transcriptional regulator [Rhodococcus sp. A14]MBA8959131.1 DNA-binding GntR family transcriptional regulator [Rhodococcus opacus]MBP2204696.1 DNA-binding GntR family transcriptional regulator [Rhodococcus opacus]MCZ4585460.1 GntR family transcriptional regulator [Rhodococcus opacus]